MTKQPIYFDPPNTGKKIAAGVAAGAGATALVVSLSGNGDAPPETTPSAHASPSTTLVTREQPRAALPVLTERAAAAHSASSAVPPILDPSCADNIIKQQQRDRLPYALEQFQVAMNDQNDPKRAYESLRNAIEHTSNTSNINKSTIASIPQAVLEKLGTTRSALQTLFEKQSLEFAKQGFETLKSDPNLLDYHDVKSIRRALENTAYPTPEAAAQAIFIDGKEANYPQLLALEDKLKAQHLAPYTENFQNDFKKARESSDTHDISIGIRTRVDTIFDVLDDGRTPPQMVEEQFRSITGLSRKDMGAFIGRHLPGYEVRNAVANKDARYQESTNSAITTAGCWTERTSQQNAGIEPRR